MQRMRKPQGNIIFKKYYFLILPLTFIDLGSKYYVNNNLVADYYFLNGFIGLDLTYNTGIALGLFRDRAGYTFILSLCVLVWLVKEIVNSSESLTTIPLILVLSRALGNLLERGYGLFIGNGGKVTDFFVLGPIPNFNVADTLITTGLILLLINAFRHKNRN